MQLPVADCGMQLLHVARVYVDSDDLVEAQRVLKLVPGDYYEEHLLKQVLVDGIVRDDVARLVEVFGYHFQAFSKTAASA
jgi:hypothetical protein